MADYFEEGESQRVLVTDLLEVTTCGNMLPGDLIVVDNNTSSVRFGTGSSGQILVTDSGSSTHLAWKNTDDALFDIIGGASGSILYNDGTTISALPPGQDGQILIYSSANAAPQYVNIGDTYGFNASGQVIVSGAGGTALIEGPGTAGQVLTISASGIARWRDSSNGTVMFSLHNGQVRPRSTQRTFSNFTWDNDTYGTGGLNLLGGELSFYAKIETGASATLEFEKVCGPASETTLFSPLRLYSGTVGLTDSSGVVTISGMTTPTDDGLYALRYTLDEPGSGPNAACGPIQTFGYQLKYNT